ncbi:thiosulfate oxidation carrier complex protein SoxZ [Pseudomonadota bacterium]
MAFATKMKIKAGGDGHEVLCLVKHPMETGLRKDSKTGELIPAHFIEMMTFQLNGTTVAEAIMGQGVSKDPLIGISIKGGKAGDKVTVQWKDNTGETGSAESAIT